MKARVTGRVLVTGAALLLAGCLGSLGGQSTVPSEKFYRLALPPLAPPTVPGPAVIAVEPVDARGVYVERSLLYRTAAAGAPLQQYPYASWAEPPDVMLQDLLMNALRTAFGPSQVLAPGQRGLPAIRLSMRLRALEQIRDGNAARARFAATYTAVDRNGGVLFVLDWDREAPASGASPLEFVNALNSLVNDADQELIDHLRGAMGRTGS